MYPKDTLPAPTLPKTLSQAVYDYLKDAIITNQLKAGQRIIDKEIADVFEISTTPVREALLRLSTEGFVSTDFHRKTVVRELSFQELRDIYEVLSILDSFAVSSVIDNINSQSLSEIERLNKKMANACQEGDGEEYLKLNAEIHREIWNTLPNKMLKKTVEFVQEQLLRYTYTRIKIFQNPELLKASINEHKKILKALKNKNKNQLKTLVKGNWKLCLDQIENKLNPGVE